VDRKPAAQVVEALIHDYYKLVFHTIYGLTGDWEESQDLTQDTFQQALKGIDAARATSGEQFQARAWLLRIALNTVRMQHRRKVLFNFLPFSHFLNTNQEQAGNQDSLAEERLHEQAAPVQPAGYGALEVKDPAETVAERDAVQRTMARLPEAMRVVLLLSIVGGLSSAEIARTLDLKEAAVRQRLARARKQFQELYQEENVPESVKTRETASLPAKTDKGDAGHICSQMPESQDSRQPDQTRNRHVAGTQLHARTDSLRHLSLMTKPGATWSSNV
jgi:RNA polymerase sigma factor, sigma-70 family